MVLFENIGLMSIHCSICLQKEAYAVTVCNHRFHVSCLQTWHQTNPACPICGMILRVPGVAEINITPSINAYWKDLMDGRRLPNSIADIIMLGTRDYHLTAGNQSVRLRDMVPEADGTVID